MDLLQPMMVAALLISGMGVAILGSVKVPLARRLQIDEAKVGGLVSLFGFAMGLFIFAAGFMTDHFGRQAVMISGSVLVAASLFCLGRATSYAGALFGVVLLSAGWALLINVGNVLTPSAFGDPSSPESKAFAFNLGNVFFGMGALLTPLAITWLLGRTSFALALSIIGCLALLPGALALGTFLITPQAEAISLSALLQDPMLWLCGVALFFYGPLEASMGAWATSFLGEHGTKELAASQLLSVFWLMFMATRLATALLFQFLKPPPAAEAVLVLVMSLCCIALFTNVVLCRGKQHAIALVIAAGGIFGPIFPTLIAMLVSHFPESAHGRAVGLFFAIGGIGWTLIPMLIGAYAKRTSVQRGFVIAIGAAVGLSIVAGILVTRT